MKQYVDDAATLTFAALLTVLFCIGLAGLWVLGASPQPREGRA